MSLEQRNKKLEWAAAILVGIFVFIILILFALSIMADSNIIESDYVAPTDWAAWDGTSENMPNTKVPVYVTEATGNTQLGIGHIKGIARNRTTANFNYIQITFGMYDGAGNKVATCLTNLAGLGIGEDWSFDATCTPWPKDGSYKIDKVSYY